jgi:hypothetical protein
MFLTVIEGFMFGGGARVAGPLAVIPGCCRRRLQAVVIPWSFASNWPISDLYSSSDVFERVADPAMLTIPLTTPNAVAQHLMSCIEISLSFSEASFS